MILPGRVAFERLLLTNIRCAKTQVQPCGIDLSLKDVLTFQSAGRIDFDNTRRQTSTLSVLPWDPPTSTNSRQSLHLQKGSYLVEFNEFIRTPRDIMGQLFVRSSVFRSGAQIHAGVMGSGYEGVIGAMLTIENSAGLLLYKDARLAAETEGYSGQYQGREHL